MSKFFICYFIWFFSQTLLAQEEAGPVTPTPPSEVPKQRYTLVETFTANLLEVGETKLGLINIERGVLTNFMLGTDFLADLIGAPNITTKTLLFEQDEHKFALGLKGAYFNKDTILWGAVKKHFKELNAFIVSPSISWTNHLSPRLNLHTHWGAGFGQFDAELTEKGRRKLWETKHPGGDYEAEEEKEQEAENENSDDKNQEADSQNKPASFKQRTLLFSSVVGMLADIFQITGEYKREGGNKFLLTSRIERTRIEDLKASSIRFTAAQQWIWDNFQFRFGIGLQYLVITGEDLDGEKIDEAGVLPASDIDLYWRF